MYIDVDFQAPYCHIWQGNLDGIWAGCRSNATGYAAMIPGWSGPSNARVTIFGDVYPLPEDQQFAYINAVMKNLNSPSQLPNGGDHCGENWKDITCSGSRVIEIKISGLGITGSMGFQVDKLTSVTNLNLAANGFNGGLPYSLTQMISLKYLHVSRNQIHGQPSDMCASLTKLSILDFSFNAMSGDLPRSFSSSTSMSDMEVHYYTGT